MNFLGHALLSFGLEGVLAGNMMGDYVKGKLALERLPADVKNGVLLHRSIDAYSDFHPATQRAKLLFREHYGLYSGAIMDTLYDHFLANDPRYFSSDVALQAFAARVYASLDKQVAVFPEPFLAMLPYMKQQDWLYGYRFIRGMEKALNGLYRRARHMPPPTDAYNTFVASYYQLNQCYYEFIEDAERHARNRLSEMGYVI